MKTHNHYIPQFYLKQWLENEQIHYYRKIVSNQNCRLWDFSNGTKNICSCEYLYCYKNDDSLENKIANTIENSFKKILEKINDRKNLDDLTNVDYENLLKYVLFQYQRTPDFLEKSSKLFNKNVYNFSDSFVNIVKDNYNITPLYIKHKGDRISFNITPLKDNCIIANVHVDNSIYYYNRYLNNCIDENKLSYADYNYTVVVAPEGENFFTCDNPVILLRKVSDNKIILNGGFMRKDTLILFPLSPKLLLMIKRGPFQKNVIKCNYEKFSYLQRYIYENAKFEVYSKEKTEYEWMKSIVDENKYKARLINVKKNTNDELSIGEEICFSTILDFHDIER